MPESKLIYKFLCKNYKDDHPCVYLYCVGQKYSPKTGLSRIYNEIEDFFCPPFDKNTLAVEIKAFLEEKKKLHKEGKIKVQSIY